MRVIYIIHYLNTFYISIKLFKRYISEKSVISPQKPQATPTSVDKLVLLPQLVYYGYFEI